MDITLKKQQETQVSQFYGAKTIILRPSLNIIKNQNVATESVWLWAEENVVEIVVLLYIRSSIVQPDIKPTCAIAHPGETAGGDTIPVMAQTWQKSHLNPM